MYKFSIDVKFQLTTTPNKNWYWSVWCPVQTLTTTQSLHHGSKLLHLKIETQKNPFDQFDNVLSAGVPLGARGHLCQIGQMFPRTASCYVALSFPLDTKKIHAETNQDDEDIKTICYQLSYPIQLQCLREDFGSWTKMNFLIQLY